MERKQHFLVNLAYFAAILAIIYLVFKYLLRLIMPFFLALIFAAVMRPLVRFISRKLHMREKIVAAITSVLFFAVIGAVAVFIAVRGVTRLVELMSGLPELYTTTIEPGITQLVAQAEELLARYDISLEQLLSGSSTDLLAALASRVTSISMSVVGGLTSVAGRLPSLLLGSVICVISTVFMAVDYQRMTSFLFGLLPERPKKLAMDIRQALKTILGKYGKSYLIIMVMTFGELAAGLLLLRVRRPVLIAALIAIMDIFPIVGAGLALLPWAVILLIQGSTAKGLGMLLLYVIITVVRQFMEPRIIGRHVGLHPLLTLLGIYVGTSLFGGLGLVGLPILMAITKQLNDMGAIHLWGGDESERLK